MKKLFTLAFFCLTITLNAQTIITGPTVSGTWNIAGSPYMIQNSVSISAGQTLTIQPGVTVKFSPSTKMNITGSLVAAGTSAQPIIFEAADTTGWSNQSSTAGGWNGIHFQIFSGGVDNTILEYCTIRDCKYGYAFLVPEVNALSSYRSLTMINCTIDHNHSGTGMYVTDAPLNLYTYANDTVIIDRCTITNNSSIFGILRTQNYSGGYTSITNSDFHDNHIGAPIWGIWNNLLIENNDIHHNTMENDNSPIKLSIGNATIRGNRVYFNECDQLAAVGCRSGKITIENNLICNNRQLDGACGATGGGGGLHLAHNEGAAAFNDTYYIVRNNVIANNFSAYGGGGIYVYHARATITNNHIINNSTAAFGKALLMLDAASEAYLKNNLFYSESPSGVVDTTQILWIFSANKLMLDYNYIPGPYHQIVQISSPFTLVGDTVNNVIGTSPDMISPTADNQYTTSAISSNFCINASSPCLNEGDTANAYPSTIDYLGNNRIFGLIDIGAFELSGKTGLEEWNNSTQLLNLYPNPAVLNSEVHISTPEAKGTIILQDLTGKIIDVTAVNQDETIIHTGNLSKGIYTVTFLGKEKLVAKMILE